MILYNEQILVVDLAKKTTEVTELEMDMIEDFVGGMALNNKLLEIYSDDKPVVIGTGPLTGTLAPGGALGVVSYIDNGGKTRHVPITQFFGAEIKYAGFDFIVIKGRAERPVYLWIHDGVADIDEASELWGCDTWSVVDAIRQEKGDDLVQVLSIGAAGEKQHPNAQLSVNYWGSLDSCGLGRIFGEKNLKAVALRGLGLIDAEEIEDMVEKSIELQQEITELGSSAADQGICRFAQEGKAQDVKKWLEPITHRHRSCFGCVISCNTFVKYNEDPGVMESTDVKEPGFLLTNFPALSVLQQCGMPADDACKLLEVCARLGVDPCAAASLIQEQQIKSFNEGRAALEQWINNPGAFETAPIKSVPEKKQILGMVLGICPELVKQLPEEMDDRLIQLASIGTGIEFRAELFGELLDKETEISS